MAAGTKDLGSPAAGLAHAREASHPAAAIDVTHLQKRYGSVVAVEDVSFMVSQGEIFGLLGPNGAGKAALREKVGVQLQQSALAPKQRVHEALSLYASFYRQPGDPRALAASLGLSGKEQAYFKDFTVNQRVESKDSDRSGVGMAETDDRLDRGCPAWALVFGSLAVRTFRWE